MIVAAAAFALQDEVKFSRTYKAGEKDKYAFKVQTKTPMGDVDMTMSMTQEILKVYDNGDADQKTTIADMKMMMNGTDMSSMLPPGAMGQPVIVRINKNGMAVAKTKAPANQGMMGGMGDLVALGNFLSEKAFKVGQPVPIDISDPKDPKTKVKGTMTLEALEAGVARVKSDLEVTSAQATKPIKVQTTAWVEVATSKPNKIEGTVNNVTGPQGMEIETIKYSMERVK